jgi:hypothetical protein
MNCVNCKKQTNNPRFCSRSCSVSHNNSVQPKRKRIARECPACKKSFFKPKSGSNQVFCSQMCRRKNYEIQISNANRFDLNGQPSPRTVRKFLVATVGNFCALCNQNGQNWCQKPLTLIVDHIDGDAYNWALNNIRLVCPNCDSQLPTFKGRNKGRSTRKYTITQK